MAKGQSVIVLPSDRKEFFNNWLNFMKPIHPLSKLRDRQMELLSLYLYERDIIMEKVKDETILKTLLFSTETRDKIMEEMGITQSNYYGMISLFKKLGIITGDSFNKKLIPELVNDKYNLLISFEVKDEGMGIASTN